MEAERGNIHTHKLQALPSRFHTLGTYAGGTVSSGNHVKPTHSMFIQIILETMFEHQWGRASANPTQVQVY
jgi:hypothetical protein